MKKVLVTGATGFIGSYLVGKLLIRGYEIRILALPDDEKASEYVKSGIEVIYGDIADAKSVSEALRGIQIVFHLAAVVSDWAPQYLYHLVNVQGTETVCRLSLENRVERVVYISTNDVFGLREDRVIDESCPHLRWHEPYSDSKLRASEVVWKYYHLGLPVTMIYPCWVYGPGDTTFMAPLIDAIISKQLVFWRKGALIWPAYVENVVDLLIEVGSNPRAIGQGFLIHDGVSDTFENFVARIAEALNLRIPHLHIPYTAALSAAVVMQSIWKILRIKSRPLLTTYIVKNLGARWQFSIAKAQDLLGWTPPVCYDEGLRRTIEWARKIQTGKIR